eukprot:Platyproteum_vivax@DN6417_c0_g1_i1.p1
MADESRTRFLSCDSHFIPRAARDSQFPDFDLNEQVSRISRLNDLPDTDIDEQVDWSHHYTTVMLKNIPNKYTKSMLLAALDERFKETYDFFYLPIDFKNECNVGYAFINFVHPYFAELFRLQFSGYKLGASRSQKVCEVAWGRVQGQKANIEHYRNSAVMGVPFPEYCPVIFKNGIEVPFPPSNRPLPRIKLRESTQDTKDSDAIPPPPQSPPPPPPPEATPIMQSPRTDDYSYFYSKSRPFWAGRVVKGRASTDSWYDSRPSRPLNPNCPPFVMPNRQDLTSRPFYPIHNGGYPIYGPNFEQEKYQLGSDYEEPSSASGSLKFDPKIDFEQSNMAPIRFSAKGYNRNSMAPHYLVNGSFDHSQMTKVSDSGFESPAVAPRHLSSNDWSLSSMHHHDPYGAYPKDRASSYDPSLMPPVLFMAGDFEHASMPPLTAHSRSAGGRRINSFHEYEEATLSPYYATNSEHARSSVPHYSGNRKFEHPTPLLSNAHYPRVWPGPHYDNSECVQLSLPPEYYDNECEKFSEAPQCGYTTTAPSIPVYELPSPRSFNQESTPFVLTTFGEHTGAGTFYQNPNQSVNQPNGINVHSFEYEQPKPALKEPLLSVVPPTQNSPSDCALAAPELIVRSEYEDYVATTHYDLPVASQHMSTGAHISVPIDYNSELKSLQHGINNRVRSANSHLMRWHEDE